MKYFIKALKSYATFRGRARRSEYWYFVLFTYLFLIVAAILDNLMGLNIAPLPYGPLFFLIYLGILIPMFAVGVRRMHDTGKSGWFLLIPLYNLILALSAGDRGDNKYGPDPKAEIKFDFEENQPLAN